MPVCVTLGAESGGARSAASRSDRTQAESEDAHSLCSARSARTQAESEDARSASEAYEDWQISEELWEKVTMVRFIDDSYSIFVSPICF